MWFPRRFPRIPDVLNLFDDGGEGSFSNRSYLGRENEDGHLLWMLVVMYVFVCLGFSFMRLTGIMVSSAWLITKMSLFVCLSLHTKMSICFLGVVLLQNAHLRGIYYKQIHLFIFIFVQFHYYCYV